jgi:hypothetical protein
LSFAGAETETNGFGDEWGKGVFVMDDFLSPEVLGVFFIGDFDSLDWMLGVFVIDDFFGFAVDVFFFSLGLLWVGRDLRTGDFDGRLGDCMIGVGSESSSKLLVRVILRCAGVDIPGGDGRGGGGCGGSVDVSSFGVIGSSKIPGLMTLELCELFVPSEEGDAPVASASHIVSN